MGLDILSPVAPAQVNVLVIPADNVKSSRFESFVARLKEVYEVRLGDLNWNAGSESFSPLAFPSGRLLFRFSTSERSVPSVDSFPFELNKEPQVVLALADGETLLDDNSAQHEGSHVGGVAASTILQGLLERLGDRKLHYRRAIVHQLLIFDLTGQAQKERDVMFVPKPTESQVTTMKTVICDIGVLFLNAMHDLANALEELPTIESPLLVTATGPQNGAQDLASRARQRMSMPLSPSPNSTSGRSPKGVPQMGATPPASNVHSEFPSRDQSRDRYSITESAASAPPSARLAVRKGRALVVRGAMYLEAGRWPDALKALSEGVAASQANIDYLWHARGLEYILICMLMFVWAKLPFEIPSVCLPSAEQRTRTGPTFYTPEASNGESVPSAQRSDHPHASTQILITLFPDVVRTILTMYTRAIAFTAEKLPQILLCEVKIRLVGMLSVVSLNTAAIDRHLLDRFLRAFSFGENNHITSVRSNVGARKEEIVNLLLEAIPSPPQNLLLNDSLEILLGISSWLFYLGLNRKQAFFLKEVLAAMIPGLVEARKIGAAEMGIHPSAGLPLLQSTSTGGLSRLKHSIKSLLTLIGQMYGVPYDQDNSFTEPNTTLQQIGTRVRIWAVTRGHGDPNLKMEILRYCINICEALPDLQGIIAFSVQLLHTARNVITLPPTHLLGPPSLSQEEQTRLFNTIKKTVGAAARLGQNDLFAEYWDDFLIRGIEPLDPSERSRFTVHSPQDLAVVVIPSTATRRDPFIYNSFAKTKARSDTNVVLTVGEMVYFAVILQNPFEFDVEIDRISLISEGCEFAASDHSIVLGHYCSQKFIMSGKPMSHGALRITGCWARVRYCHERSFRIFSKQWSPERDIKLQLQRSTKDRPKASDSEQPDKLTSASVKDPEPDILSLTVLESQPMFSFASTTLSQPAIMLLEGETKPFQLTIYNASTTASADFLLFTFQDSATTQLQDALAGRELSPTEQYELQLQLAGSPSLRWVPEENDGSEPIIAPGASSTFTFEVFGKPGLLSGVIQVDYAHMGVPRSEMREKFYTRQLRYPLSLTVNGAIEIPRCNILPFTGDFAWSNQQRIDYALPSTKGNLKKGSAQNRSRSATAIASLRDDDQLMPLLSRLGLGSHGCDHCLLLLDLRNVWPNPLSISIQVRESSTKTTSPTDPWRRAYTVHELLQPSHISRVVLLLPRLFIRDPHAPIPLIGNQRQFVVSASKLSAESEAANRETFWYREELLKYVRGTWRDESTGREGEINIRKGIRLSARMIDAIRIDDIEIDFSIQALEEPSDSETNHSVKAKLTQTGRVHFVLQTNIFAKLKVKIYNHSSDRMHLLLRLQPSLRNQPHNIALDLSKRFAWTGMLQRSLHPPLEAGEIREAELGVIALCEGDFEIGATVEEVRPTVKQAIQSGSLPLGAVKRRIWHARGPCLIDAVDNEDP
jgi:trafficking protein particle complex subunit 9